MKPWHWLVLGALALWWLTKGRAQLAPKPAIDTGNGTYTPSDPGPGYHDVQGVYREGTGHPGLGPGGTGEP